jgi:hypothetical protein
MLDLDTESMNPDPKHCSQGEALLKMTVFVFSGLARRRFGQCGNRRNGKFPLG